MNHTSNMEDDGDQEIPDPEELERVASIFKDGTWFEWEVEGVRWPQTSYPYMADFK
ncbi:MAG: hypothetical protein JST84_04995 [Acidobacteria bacterium]|nr:hypothetical protein [Acidobacteriota bacterium]